MLAFKGAPTTSISIDTAYPFTQFRGQTTLATIRSPSREVKSSFTPIHMEGLYNFEHSLSGEDLDSILYLQPEDSIVLVNNRGANGNNNITTLLSGLGCCSFEYNFQFSIPSCSEKVKFISSCSWREGSNIIETNGVVHIQRGDFSLPLSIGGLTHNSSSENFKVQIAGFTEPQCKSNCSQCPNCSVPPLCIPNSYALTSQDIQYMLSNRALLTTFFDSLRSFFPPWLSLQLPSATSSAKYSLYDYIYFIGSKANALNINGCEMLPLSDNNLIYIARSSTNMEVNLSSVVQYYTRDSNDLFPICYALDMCSGRASLLHVGVPASVAKFISSLSPFQMFINKGWSMVYNYLTLGYFGVSANFHHQQFWTGSDYVAVNNSFDYQIHTQLNANLTSDSLVMKFKFNGLLMYKLNTLNNEVS